MAVLPIFPLGAVLMPGSELPLQVFEPRYVVMLRDLLATAGREFVVVAIRLGTEVGDQPVELHEVGCVATIEQAAATGDGRFAVVVQGQRRCRVGTFSVTATPYLQAHVTDLPEEAFDDRLGAEMLTLVLDLLQDYARVLPGSIERIELADDLTAADGSYALAEAMHLPLADEQRLLEAADPVSRLVLAARLLRREISILSRIGAVPIRPGMLNGEFSSN